MQELCDVTISTFPTVILCGLSFFYIIVTHQVENMERLTSFDATSFIDLSILQGLSITVKEALVEQKSELKSELDETKNVFHNEIEKLRIVMENRKFSLQRNTSNLLEKQTSEKVCRRHFIVLLKFTKRQIRRRQRHYIQTQNEKKLLRSYLYKFTLFQKIAVTRARTMRYLLIKGMRGLLRARYDSWTQHRRKKAFEKSERSLAVQSAVHTMAHGNRLLLLQNRFNSLLTSVHSCRLRKQHKLKSHSLLVQNGKILCQTHFDTWVRWGNVVRLWRARRNSALNHVLVLQPKTENAARQKYSRKLRRWAEIRIRTRGMFIV